MSSIDGIGPARPGRPPARARPAAGAGFTLGPMAEPASGTAMEPARSAGTEAAASVVAAGMLALQEIAAETVRDRAARRHGRALLAALSRLQHQLLGAGDAAAAVDEIGALAAEMPHAGDPALAAALDAVMLRARVEMARHGR